MRITIFGATGMTGQRAIDEALAHGHEVRAFGRNVFEALSTERERLELFKGGVLSHGDVEDAVKGADAVISCLGGGIDGIDRTRSLGMKTIVEAMKKKGPKRIIAIGTIGILQAKEAGKLRYQMPGYSPKFKAVAVEHFEAWQYLLNSPLNWTLLCPPEIRDEPTTGQYNLKLDYPADGPMWVNAGDLAHFMMHELQADEWVKARVGIAARV
ncbi:MAG: SDR family oxidoreductase [Saprospiraceae bacterium]|nr:SDR family oxidoreductase [Saprospiraceae bacterium]MCF8250654.1 SDR family oxidoreductase [Saprospiraceae bacterium]MCF8280792.1 SDR family oxidoreductase [Bacteroidales bacterium]MCF8312506.1 SDR family oxidoreductase [Saprospiraceae bacterium]MCF8440814.1 SDR family oxidoreductase [Saprospiraceae bacterium]